ncbi:MAG: hypothetical protein Q8L87_10130 [Anaerolineales bacterium]|nr:hypothetical protein [Anaerolineales bacterium]
MFRKNTKHQQPALIPYGHDVSAASELPEKQRKRLENSWAGTFYKEFFSRIDEQSFAVLYSEKDSRPNVPVNVLVGLEALKAGFGWSDQELYENYCYDTNRQQHCLRQPPAIVGGSRPAGRTDIE